jgi:hypothetical protein
MMDNKIGYWHSKEYFIVKYVPFKGRTKFEIALKKLAREYGFKFIGSGYDKTNNSRDIEWWRGGH